MKVDELKEKDQYITTATSQAYSASNSKFSALRNFIFCLDTLYTIYFAAHFVWLLFEGGIYFFGKPGDTNDGWIGYEEVRHRNGLR